MTEKSFIRADAVAEELDVSKSYSYKFIKQLNDELSAKGYITIVAVSYTHLDVYKRQGTPNTAAAMHRGTSCTALAEMCIRDSSYIDNI